MTAVLVLLVVGPAAPAAGSVPAGDACGLSPVARALVLAGRFRPTEDPDAGAWATWLVDPSSVAPPPPPEEGSPEAIQELAELHRMQLNRTNTQILEAQSWAEGPASRAWEDLFAQLLVEHAVRDRSSSTPDWSRWHAMYAIAIEDALVAAWAAKYCHYRPPPSAVDPLLSPVVRIPDAPAYPSEHAVVAGAAIEILKAAFPCPTFETCDEPPEFFEGIARAVAEGRLIAGANRRSDVEAGLALGRAVGAVVVAARAGDGSDRADVPATPTGPCLWRDIGTTPAIVARGPMKPWWGDVTPFLVGDVARLRPPPPPACGGEAYRAELRDLYEASRSLSDAEKRTATKWAQGQGTWGPAWGALVLAQNASLDAGSTTARHARVMAHASVAVADATIATWDAKYAYWDDRPVTGMRDTIDPAWISYLFTTPSPGYVSEHAAMARAAAEVAAAFAPESATTARAVATEIGVSRFHAGVHTRSDVDAAHDLGAAVAALAIERARGDGGPMPG